MNAPPSVAPLLTRRFRIIKTQSEPRHGYILEPVDKCPHRFPPCPQIRCQKPIHDQNVVCYAVNVKPYYSLFWMHVEPDLDVKEEGSCDR